MENRWPRYKLNIVPYQKVKILALIFTFATSACSIETSLIGHSESSTTPPEAEELRRTSPDFVAAEVVTTNLGYQVRAVFGDTSEKVTLSNGYQIEGVFYE